MRERERGRIRRRRILRGSNALLEQIHFDFADGIRHSGQTIDNSAAQGRAQRRRCHGNRWRISISISISHGHIRRDRAIYASMRGMRGLLAAGQLLKQLGGLRLEIVGRYRFGVHRLRGARGRRRARRREAVDGLRLD